MVQSPVLFKIDVHHHYDILALNKKSVNFEKTGIGYGCNIPKVDN